MYMGRMTPLKQRVSVCVFVFKYQNYTPNVWSPGSDTGCQFIGCEFEPQLGQHSFRRFTKDNTTIVIRIPPLGGKKPIALNDCRIQYWRNKSRETYG